MSTTTTKPRRRRLRYEHWRSRSNGQYYAHLRSGSEIQMATEGYPEKRLALKPGKALERAGCDLVWKEIEDPNRELTGTGSPEPRGKITVVSMHGE